MIEYIFFSIIKEKGKCLFIKCRKCDTKDFLLILFEYINIYNLLVDYTVLDLLILFISFIR